MAKFVPGPVPMGNIVEEYYIGNTHIIICDDAYRNRSKEEQQQSLERFARIASEALRNQMLAEQLREQQEAEGRDAAE